MIDAGHRCAIPTCRATATLNIEHITDYAIVQEHTYENMIVLCANCHGRKTKGEIDRKSLLQYKANLAVINSRYSDLERRVLEVLADQRRRLAPVLTEHITNLAQDWPRGISVQLPGTLRLMMTYLIKDGIIEVAPAGTAYVGFLGTETFLLESTPALNGPVPDVEYYRLTDAGLEFLDAWIGARPLDETDKGGGDDAGWSGEDNR